MVVRLGLQRIPEEDEQVDLPIRDLGADLLIPAEGAAVETGHRQPGLFAEHPPRGCGRVQTMAGPQVTVELRPFEHVLLAAVMCDQRNPPLRPGPGRSGGLRWSHMTAASRTCSNGRSSTVTCWPAIVCTRPQPRGGCSANRPGWR